MLIAAADETPKKLVAEGHAVAGSNFTYAVGRLVLWNAQPGFVDAQGAALGSAKVARVAIANPKIVPYGAAALDVLEARGLVREITPRLVTAESTAQAFQFVAMRVIGGKSAGMGSTLNVGAQGSPLQGELGKYESPSRIDGVVRMASYHRVADYPLYVTVLRSKEEALANWNSTRTMALLLTAGLSAAIIASALIFSVGVRRLEETNAALRVSEAKAHAANEAKTEFLAAVSHELRTPLTSIRGFSELMEARLKEPKFREQAGLIRKAAEYLNTLLTEILDLVKVEAGAMSVEKGAVPLRALIDGAASFFAITAAEKGLELNIRIADDVPHTVDGDELRLKQIMNNLLSNAFKFTEQGQVRIEADCSATQLRLHVVDTGPGIPEHLHETIFERFRQGDDRVSYQHGGTGLGLALSRALAELMGGTLTVASRPGEGARFTLALPLH